MRPGDLPPNDPPLLIPEAIGEEMVRLAPLCRPNQPLLVDVPANLRHLLGNVPAKFERPWGLRRRPAGKRGYVVYGAERGRSKAPKRAGALSGLALLNGERNGAEGDACSG